MPLMNIASRGGNTKKGNKQEKEKEKVRDGSSNKYIKPNKQGIWMAVVGNKITIYL